MLPLKKPYKENPTWDKTIVKEKSTTRISLLVMKTSLDISERGIPILYPTSQMLMLAMP